MDEQSQLRYRQGGQRTPAWANNPIGRVFAFLGGLLALAVAVFLGAIFIAGLVGLVLIGAVVFIVRAWLLRRKMERYAREHGDIEAEYTVITEDSRRRD